MVATLRTRGLATARNAALTPGQTPTTFGSSSSRRWVTIAPTERSPRVAEAPELAHVLQGDPVVGLDQPLADQDAQERPARDDRRLGVVRTEAQHFIDAGRQVPRHDVLLLRAVLVLDG